PPPPPPPPEPAPPTPAATDTVSDEPPRPPHTPHAGHALQDLPRAVGFVALPASSAAVLLLALRRRRQRRAVYRQPQHSAAPPLDGDMSTERALRAIAAEDTAEWLHAVNRLLTRTLRTITPTPIPLLVRVGQRG